MLWWFLGPLTLLPILLGRPVAWDVATAQALIPSLLGHLAYGAVTAAVLALLSPGERRFEPGLVVRATAAGLLTAPVLGLGWRGLIVGALVGASYAVIFGERGEGSGPALIRGAAFGFAWWALAAVTISPLLDGRGLQWTPAAVRVAVASLPGHLLLGAGTACSPAGWAAWRERCSPTTCGTPWRDASSVGGSSRSGTASSPDWPAA